MSRAYERAMVVVATVDDKWKGEGRLYCSCLKVAHSVATLTVTYCRGDRNKHNTEPRQPQRNSSAVDWIEVIWGKVSSG